MNIEKAAKYFDERISKDSNGCWNWRGTKTRLGYGICSIDEIKTTAHRGMYYLLYGNIQCGLEIDHLCKNTLCVNPSHLEAITRLENIRRGSRATQTHCIHGHEFTKNNTYFKKSNGTRVCRACSKLRQKLGRIEKPHIYNR